MVQCVVVVVSWQRSGGRVFSAMEPAGWLPAQLSRISDLLDTVVLSNMGDRRFWDLNGDGCFCVKDVRRMLDDMLLPISNVPSRWVKQIPIKVNVLAWKISMDRLPTRVNLHRRGVQVSPISCPICCEALENLDHLLFCCDLAKDIARSICNWWGLVWNSVDSYRSWLSWFNLVQLQSSSKQVLEGVFYTFWFGHIETISSSLIQILEKMANQWNNQDDGWAHVNLRKKEARASNINHSYHNRVGTKPPFDFDRVMKSKATSFLFSNFPDSWDSSAFWKMFGRYGRVVDVYIAFKKTKKDTRFGFVRFINIGDINSFERRLKGILIGNGGNTFPVMIYEDIFNASSLISPPSLNDDEDSIFEEEFIGTSMSNGDRNDHAPSSDRCSDSSEEEKFKATHSLISSHRTSSEPRIGSDRDSNDNIEKDLSPTPNGLHPNGNNKNNRPAHCVIEPIPDLRAPLKVVEDQELDELLSYFHRISNLANKPRPTDGKKKRTKHKKKKLMERKSDSINDFFIRSIWPRPYIEYAFTSSVSASGGSPPRLVSSTFTPLKAVGGDEKSRFFHSLLKHKIANSMIRGININGVWCDSPDMIKLSAIEHFASRFKEHDHEKPSFYNSLFRRLYVEDSYFLESSIFMDEVKEAVRNYDGSKALGPDGFNFKFIKFYWEKILANRLAKVISSVIGPNQSAFYHWKANPGWANAKNLILILSCFETASGLKINLVKSRLFGIGVSSEDVEVVASSLGCSHDILPFMYIGLPESQRGISWVKWKSIPSDIDKESLGDLNSLFQKPQPSWKVKMKDPWCVGGFRLMDIFPRLFALESSQDSKDFTACDVPKFDGTLDPITSARWLSAVKAGKNTTPIGSCTFKEFKELFNAEYAPAEEVDKIREDFQTVMQTNETVNELWKKVNDLIPYCPEYHGNKKLNVERFQSMLHDDIREVICPFKCTALDDLLSRAKVREVDLLRKKNKKAKETKRKLKFRDLDTKKPKHDHGRRSGETQTKTPCKKCHETHLRDCGANLPAYYKCEKKDPNMRQQRWLDLLKDYDCEIRYHLALKEEKWKSERITSCIPQLEDDNRGIKIRQGIFAFLSEAMSKVLLEEAHNLKYSIHPRAMKMYLDLKKNCWWPGFTMERCVSVQEQGKLSPRFIRLFKILKRVEEVAYDLELIEEMKGIHNTFHMSYLRKCLVDKSNVITLDDIEIDPEITFREEPMTILGRKSRQLHNKVISLVKVQWKHRKGTSIRVNFPIGSKEEQALSFKLEN
nr:hypothetical protein [Tanacetum cinerariifolium]